MHRQNLPAEVAKWRRCRCVHPTQTVACVGLVTGDEGCEFIAHCSVVLVLNCSADPLWKVTEERHPKGHFESDFSVGAC